MLTERADELAPNSMIPRTTVASLLDLAHQAFAEGYAPLGERLIDLVHESFSPGARNAYQ